MSSSPFFFLDDPSSSRRVPDAAATANDDDDDDDEATRRSRPPDLLRRRTFGVSSNEAAAPFSSSTSRSNVGLGGGHRPRGGRGGDDDDDRTTGPAARRIEDLEDDGAKVSSGQTTAEKKKKFYGDIRRDELELIRDCWFAARGIDSERLQFVRKQPPQKQQQKQQARSSSSKTSQHNETGNSDGSCGGGCCRRHLSLAEGRTRSVALQLLNDRMYPLFVASSGGGTADGDSAKNGGYWSLLGSGAWDAVQIIGQAGAAWKDVEACQWYLLHDDGGDAEDSLSSASGIRRALAAALEDELQSIRATMASHRLDACVLDVDDDDGWANASPTLRQFLVKMMPITSRLVSLQNLGNSWRQHVNFHVMDNDNDHELPSGSIRLLNLILAQSRSGDPRIAQLCHKVWRAAVEPWYRRLHIWITEGRVPTGADNSNNSARHPLGYRRGGAHVSADSARRRSRSATHDFFVESANDADVEPKDLWRLKFRLRAANVPSGTLTPQQVKSAFLIGKGINYFQACLGECLVVDDDVNVTGSDEKPTLSDHPELYFSRLIQSASARVHSRILEALHTDHKLLHHLLALKQFLLLGQGDFVSSFMAGLMDEFGSGNAVVRRGKRDGNPYTMPGMHRHALNGILDASLRSSNAMNFSNDILKRLHVGLVNPSSTEGDEPADAGDFSFSSERRSTASREKSAPASTESVWDKLSFSYTLPDPLVAIVTQGSMTHYTKLFRFLFAVRRIEMLLNLTWRQSSFLQQEIHLCAQRCAINVSKHETYAQANILLRQIAMTRQAMMHFCLNLNSYLMYEVLETEWKRLVRAAETASTLDELIAAHGDYLNCVYRKSLLSLQDEIDDDGLGRQVHELLRLTNAFCAYQEEVFGEALGAVQRAADKRREAELQETSGKWAFGSVVEEEETFFGLADTSKLLDLANLSSAFDEMIVRFLRTLDRRLNGRRMKAADEESTVAGRGRQIQASDEDLDSLRFLEFQLNHNGYYGNALDESHR